MSVTLPYTLSGMVMHGNALGRKIDMPTANIVPGESLEGLELGVYYSRVLIGEKEYKAITNLGKKPTIKDNDVINAESFLYDFEGEIYDEVISVTLLEFRRPEKKFSSFEELSEEMHRDLDAGRNY